MELMDFAQAPMGEVFGYTGNPAVALKSHAQAAADALGVAVLFGRVQIDCTAQTITAQYSQDPKPLLGDAIRNHFAQEHDDLVWMERHGEWMAVVVIEDGHVLYERVSPTERVPTVDFTIPEGVPVITWGMETFDHRPELETLDHQPLSSSVLTELVPSQPLQPLPDLIGRWNRKNIEPSPQRLLWPCSWGLGAGGSMRVGRRHRSAVIAYAPSESELALAQYQARLAAPPTHDVLRAMEHGYWAIDGLWGWRLTGQTYKKDTLSQRANSPSAQVRHATAWAATHGYVMTELSAKDITLKRSLNLALREVPGMIAPSAGAYFRLVEELVSLGIEFTTVVSNEATDSFYTSRVVRIEFKDQSAVFTILNWLADGNPTTIIDHIELTADAGRWSGVAVLAILEGLEDNHYATL